MSQTNPLHKYYRQPKLFISLPSQGLYYSQGNLKGDYNNVPVFGMTGIDEIMFKTPDALFNGEATSSVIESCCPYITDAKNMPSFDVDSVLIAIRIATYGETMTVSSRCSNCSAENDYDIDLRKIIEYFSGLSFDNTVQLGEISIRLKPLTYQQLTGFSLENFKLQRMLFQIGDISEQEQKDQLDTVYKRLGELQVELFMSSIESVSTPESAVSDPDLIRDWLQNSDRTVYNTVKEKLEKNKDAWSVPKQPVKCSSCGHEEDIGVELDQSNFFG